jgi:hypothetical protein
VVYAAAFWVIGTKLHPSKPRKRNRGGAHGARLQGHIEVASSQPLTVMPGWLDATSM